MSRPAEPAIVFDRVWKKFRRGEIHDSLRDLIPALSRRFLPGRKGAPRKGDFWAVRNLSFTVDAGEVLGIIGGNGAGKSTTLKILTRILRPTAGRASVRGRMGALIEISAGFHQDLTGRENVFLQGSIMGMPVAQIRRKFDQIVAFSGIEDFIDTPVKRYSSGMQARLGFAIAAHLDPEVLIIDEVLSVGDFRFQEKAFGRIKEMSRSGIPVVLVSHQLDRVATLCTKAIVLQQGQVLREGEVSDCIDSYLSGGLSLEAVDATGLPIVLGGARIVQGTTLRWGQEIDIDLSANIPGSERDAFDAIGLRIRALDNNREMFVTHTRLAGLTLPRQGNVRCRISLAVHLPKGTYTLEPFALVPGVERQLCSGPISTCHVEVPTTTLDRGMVSLGAGITLLSDAEPAPARLAAGRQDAGR